MKIFYLLLFLLFFSVSVISLSCVSQSHQQNSTYDVALTITKRIPYCGGVELPVEEDLFQFQPVKNTVFYIKKDTINTEKTKALWKIETNENGKANIKLPKGKYCLIIEEKRHSYRRFRNMITKTLDPKLYKQKPDHCFEKWYHSCDHVFEVEPSGKNINVKVVFIHVCYLGSNPCIIYKGAVVP